MVISHDKDSSDGRDTGESNDRDSDRGDRA